MKNVEVDFEDSQLITSFKLASDYRPLENVAVFVAASKYFFTQCKRV